jgi:hypothetical protein
MQPRGPVSGGAEVVAELIVRDKVGKGQLYGNLFFLKEVESPEDLDGPSYRYPFIETIASLEYLPLPRH